MPRLLTVLATLLSLHLQACKRDEAPPSQATGQAASETLAGTQQVMQPAATPPQNAGTVPAGHPPLPSTASPGPKRDVQPNGATLAQRVAELAFDTPKEWQLVKSDNAMRLAQYVLPGPGGDAELVLFRFPGGAGGVDANLARWKSQFSPPAGKTLDDVSSVTSLEHSGLKITLLDISGDYASAMGPAVPGGAPKLAQRMLAAIVQGSGDPFFFKCLGSAATLAVWATPFETVLKSLRVER